MREAACFWGLGGPLNWSAWIWYETEVPSMQFVTSLFIVIVHCLHHNTGALNTGKLWHYINSSALICKPEMGVKLHSKSNFSVLITSFKLYSLMYSSGMPQLRNRVRLLLSVMHSLTSITPPNKTVHWKHWLQYRMYVGWIIIFSLKWQTIFMWLVKYSSSLLWLCFNQPVIF